MNHQQILDRLAEIERVACDGEPCAACAAAGVTCDAAEARVSVDLVSRLRLDIEIELLRKGAHFV